MGQSIELLTFGWIFSLYLVVLILLDIWVLWQKGRSYFYLFYVLAAIFLGQIIFLCMANKKKPVVKGSLVSYNIPLNTA